MYVWTNFLLICKLWTQLILFIISWYWRDKRVCDRCHQYLGSYLHLHFLIIGWLFSLPVFKEGPWTLELFYVYSLCLVNMHFVIWIKQYLFSPKIFCTSIWTCAMDPERNWWGLFVVRWGNQPANVLLCVEYAIKWLAIATLHTQYHHMLMKQL